MHSPMSSPAAPMSVLRRSRLRTGEGADALTRGLLVAFLLLGLLLRFLTLDSQSFDLDESVTVALLHHGLAGMLQAIPETESTPPLYYVLAWAWTKLFGLDEVGLRSLSALIGSAMIPLAYVTARRLASPRAGVIAAGLTAVSPWLIWYSQESRAYALFALLSLASFACFLAALESQSRRPLLGWALTSALALACHYFAIFLIAPEALWLLARGRARREPLLAVGVVVLAGIALLPLATEQAHDIRAKAGFLRTPLASRITAIPTRFLLGEAAPSGSKAVLVLAASLLVAVGAVFLLQEALSAGRSSPLSSALCVALIALIVPVVLALAGRDYLDARNLIGVWAPLAVLLAAGYEAMGRPGAVAATCLGALFLAMVIVGDTDVAVQRADYRGVAAALGPSPGPGERAIVVSPDYNWTPLAYYLPDYPRLGPGDAGLREIDLIGWKTQSTRHAGLAALQRRGFRVVQERTVQKLRLIRLLAPAAVSVGRSELLAGRLGEEGATVLIQAR